MLGLNMCIITDLVSANAILSSKDTYSGCGYGGLVSVLWMSHSFLSPPRSFGFVYAEERGSCGEWGQKACAARRAPHCHMSHSTSHLIRGGTGSPVSSFHLFNILLLPTAHNVFINSIYNITTLHIMYAQIYVYVVGHCIVSSIIKQKYVCVLCPRFKYF